MKALLPNAVFIGFTGTPLLKADRQKSIEVFGRYIHTYKFDQAVREGVVLDLRYEARDIGQTLGDKGKIDQWFEARTQGLSDLARAQLKQKWGTMQKVLSSRSRLERIVADILFDMNTRPRLIDGHGNAMLVAGSIYEACKVYSLFARSGLKGKCAIVTSFAPTAAEAKGETTGEGETGKLFKYRVYSRMLADWFDEPAEKALHKVEKFEQAVKKKFIDQPGQTSTTSAPWTRATPGNSRTTKRSAWSSTSSSPRCCAPTLPSPTNWPKPAIRPPRSGRSEARPSITARCATRSGSIAPTTSTSRRMNPACAA